MGGWGMKGVDTIARIRRAHFVQGKTIKEIVRELHVSRNTVRKVLRSGETAFSYQRERQPLPRIGPFQAELDRLLEANEGKAARERLTHIRIFEELRGLGYEGGYDAVRRYARGWRRVRSATVAGAFVPLSFAPGEPAGLKATCQPHTMRFAGMTPDAATSMSMVVMMRSKLSTGREE
jgi:transposase